MLRFAGGRELTLGDPGTRQGVLGGINAVIVGNYLTTLGRSPQEDLDLLAELRMPVKELKHAVTHCAGCGRPAGEGDHSACERRQQAPTRPASAPSADASWSCRFCRSDGGRSASNAASRRGPRAAAVKERS